MRFFLVLSFEGSAYHGWQIQKNAESVQGVLQNCLSTILREEIEITGAGRTDTGVHALEMMAHFDLSKESLPNDFLYHLNALLPKDIAVSEVYAVHKDAHARFDALSREYRYHIHQKKDPFKNGRSWYYPFSVDIDKMNEASHRLKTFDDFACFSKSGGQTKTTLCKVDHAEWTQKGDEIEFVIRADRFLRNMVRAIVGTMIEIGKGVMKVDDLNSLIESGDRSRAGFSVPAHGLYLSKIEYPKNIKINHV